MVKVFVYGSLKRNFSANNLLDSGTFLGRASLRNYTLYPVCSWPGIKPSAGGSVAGEVYEVDDDTARRLDSYEGAPRLFTRVEGEVVSMELEDRRTTCYFYVYNGDVSNLTPLEDGIWELIPS